MKKYFLKFATMIAVILGVAFASSCSKGGEVGDIDGTWVATLDTHESVAAITVTIEQPTATFCWEETYTEKGTVYNDTETEYYDQVTYDHATQKLTAHRYKKVIVSNGQTEVKTKDNTETYYVTWVDEDHIYIGNKPGEYEEDFGKLERQ